MGSSAHFNDPTSPSAKERAEEAKREYEAMKASATERQAAIKAKLSALGAS